MGSTASIVGGVVGTLVAGPLGGLVLAGVGEAISTSDSSEYYGSRRVTYDSSPAPTKSISADPPKHPTCHSLVTRKSVSFGTSVLSKTAKQHTTKDCEEKKKSNEIAQILIKESPFPAVKFKQLLTPKPTGQALVLKGEYLGDDVAVKLFLDVNELVQKENKKKEVEILIALNTGSKSSHIMSMLVHFDSPSPAIVYPLMTKIEWSGRAIDPIVVTQYAKQIASGLKFMHDRKIAHRDIKTDNILVDSRGRAVIIDFGFACRFTGIDAIEYCGTYPFMAPEILSESGCKSDTSKVDVYAFAMTLYQMLTGKEPWEDLFTTNADEYVDKLKLKVVSGSRLQMDSRWSSYLQNTIQECWQGDPEARPKFDTILNMIM